MIWLEILNKKRDDKQTDIHTDKQTNEQTNKQTDKLFRSIVYRNKATLASGNNNKNTMESSPGAAPPKMNKINLG